MRRIDCLRQADKVSVCIKSTTTTTTRQRVHVYIVCSRTYTFIPLQTVVVAAIWWRTRVGGGFLVCVYVCVRAYT